MTLIRKICYIIHPRKEEGEVMRYHLVLEARPGDFMPIDINIISHDKLHRYEPIEEIDSFTKRFSLEEIMGKIIKRFTMKVLDQVHQHL